MFKGDNATVGGTADTPSTLTGTRRQDRFAEELEAIPEVKALGPLFKSSIDYELTDSGTEYVVTCVVHTFRQHIVLQVSRVLVPHFYAVSQTPTV